MESVVQFGRHQCVGILSEPEAVRSGTPCVILLNAGLLHNVGPFCLHVTLARALGQRGFRTLRFDFAGVGDSGPRASDSSESDNAHEDMKNAMDAVYEKTGVQEFVFAGLCSGADYAHQIAVSDPRVVGTVVLDGYAFPTPGFYLRKYTKLLREPQRAFDIFRLKLSNVFLGEAPVDGEYDFGDFPPRYRVEREMSSLVERGVQMLCIYSGAWPSFNHTEQFQKMYRSVEFGDELSVRYLSQADHTYSMLDDRTMLIESIVEWMFSRFGKDVAPADSTANWRAVGL